MNIQIEKWRNPSFEELKDGDNLQIMTSYGWQDGKWPSILDMDTHVNLFGGDSLQSKFNYASLRILSN